MKGTLTSDHCGALYLVDRQLGEVVEGGRPRSHCVLRKLQLPEALGCSEASRAAPAPVAGETAAEPPAAGVPSPGPAAGGAAAGAAVASGGAFAAAAEQVVVRSLRLPEAWTNSLGAGVNALEMVHHHDGSGGECLLLSAGAAIYRLPLGAQPAPASPPLVQQEAAQPFTELTQTGLRPPAAQPDEAPAPQLLAGADAKTASAKSAPADGFGDAARFGRVMSNLVEDGRGALLLLDGGVGRPDEIAELCAIRRVHPHTGAVATVGRLKCRADFASLSITANGWLFVSWADACDGTLIDLGLVPPPSLQPRRRTLPADLGALLGWERTAGGGGGGGSGGGSDSAAADVTIRVGERSFPAHRLILSARCDYFKQRLAGDGGFADGRAAELELADADPDAFALVLRWLYTGGAHIPAEQARGVGGLADRLLLPELCDAALEVMVETLAPETVVDSLLWAARMAHLSRGFAQRLEELKAWYVAHHELVCQRAPASVRRLMEARSDLAFELMCAQSRGASRREQV
ncbi:hypothetical protein HYH02_009230 [Chlamydomonas schloesseri]|uniref:BTB domain-containing protein n=1 Tax=Chlamydomonas schloesseri TaxID=2026947 RepID=A0A835WAX8_9CHLO|nr:hypothetical protein HYH02_009230 [Chlamydomonas schloesseri]|eukprot:KAG2444032.1 hypothetical protein HYH02_009230 [Chlamydomonas schloesseri]